MFSTPVVFTADYWVGLRKVDDVWMWADGSTLDDVQVATLPWASGYETHDCVRMTGYLLITQDGCSNTRSFTCQTDAAGACLVIDAVVRFRVKAWTSVGLRGTANLLKTLVSLTASLKNQKLLL